MSKILVLGASGQLGRSMQEYLRRTPSNLEFVFAARTDLDICSYDSLKLTLLEIMPSIIINCAAYTAVDRAELEVDLAMNINFLAVKNITSIANEIDATLIHISTDFVFDGSASKPRIETDECKPLGIYGDSKHKGELAIIDSIQKHYIIRTSWLYSNVGANFFTTISKLAGDREQLNIVFDQIGTPTYTMDLVQAIFQIIDSNKTAYGIYHYSNEGVCSWYDFAKELVSMQNITCKIFPIRSEQYPTPAKRPAYSVLDKQKIKSTFDLQIPYWRDSLATLITESL